MILDLAKAHADFDRTYDGPATEVPTPTTEQIFALLEAQAQAALNSRLSVAEQAVKDLERKVGDAELMRHQAERKAAFNKGVVAQWELATAELRQGDARFYLPQEAAFAPGIVKEWPEVIPHPTDNNGRLVLRTFRPPMEGA